MPALATETSNMPFRVEPMARSFGSILHAIRPGQSVDTLLPFGDMFREMLGAEGALLLRGFALDVAGFEKFSSLFSDQFYPHHEINDGNRVKVSDTVATVNVGGDPFPWHCERGYGPFPPDIIFFFCQIPSRAEGGETWVTDGCSIFNELAPETREFVSDRRVSYTYRFRKETWPLALSGATTQEEAQKVLSDISARLRPDEKLIWQFSPHLVAMQFTTTMVKQTRWSKRPAFCNQVVFQKRINRVTLDDGAPVPDQMVMEADKLGWDASYAIKWQVGDAAVIDNSRVMHARGQIADPQRKILARICYADF